MQRKQGAFKIDCRFISKGQNEQFNLSEGMGKNQANSVIQKQTGWKHKELVRKNHWTAQGETKQSGTGGGEQGVKYMKERFTIGRSWDTLERGSNKTHLSDKKTQDMGSKTWTELQSKIGNIECSKQFNVLETW